MINEGPAIIVMNRHLHKTITSPHEWSGVLPLRLSGTACTVGSAKAWLPSACSEEGGHSYYGV